MRYIICGIDDKKGTINNDSPSLSTYFELGWEISTTHLDCKFLYEKNILNKDDTIVTCEGREFFYQKLFDNVITWEKFKTIEKDSSQILNLMENRLNSIFKRGNYDNSLCWDDGVPTNNCTISPDIATSFNYKDVSKYDLSQKFCCFVIRKRSHWSNRNIPIHYATELMNFINGIGYKIYIVGHDSEDLCDGQTKINVDLGEFATLLNNKNCSFLISTLTGPPHLSYLCGNDDLINIILDLHPSRDTENLAFNMGVNIKYTKTKDFFFKTLPQIDIIKNKIKEIHENFNMHNN